MTTADDSHTLSSDSVLGSASYVEVTSEFAKTGDWGNVYFGLSSACNFTGMFECIGESNLVVAACNVSLSHTVDKGSEIPVSLKTRWPDDFFQKLYLRFSDAAFGLKKKFLHEVSNYKKQEIYP